MAQRVRIIDIAEKAGVPCVPYILSKVKTYAHLNAISKKKLGTDLVIQTPFESSSE